MKTNELIRLLAQDAPVRQRLGRRMTLALAAALLLSLALFLATTGFRADIADAMMTGRFVLKMALAIAFAVAASRLLWSIGRPGAVVKGSIRALVSVPILLAFAVLVELIVVPSSGWRTAIMGHNARFCLAFIPLLSIAPLVVFLAALRSGAPANPGLAGASAGLAASGIAAVLYASNCVDDSPLFVMLWYPVAIAGVMSAGYLAGSRLLR